MKCKICGAEMSEGNLYCLACGAKLDPAPAAQSQPAPWASANLVDPPWASAPAAAAASEPAAAPAPAPVPETVTPEPKFFEDNMAPIVKTGQWLGTLLLLLFVPIAAAVVAAVLSGLINIPLVTTILAAVAGLTPLIMMFLWAFGRKTNPSKRNFFRAELILLLILIAITVILVLLFTLVLSAEVLSFIDLDQITDIINSL